jgi:sugar phosphate isomerase/epimerase
MKNPLHDIRIGTLVPGNNSAPEYIRQIKPHGFESFGINFWQTLGGVNVKELAPRVRDAIGSDDIQVNCLGIFGNPLGDEAQDEETRRGFEMLIDHADLFGAKTVVGFAGRVRGKKIEDSLSRFKEVFAPLTQRAADLGVRIAFENCDMGDTWQTGTWNIAHAPEAWEMMFNEVPAENLGLEWEPCHQMVSLIDPLPQLKKWLPKIFHVHGKDATVMWDVIRTSGIRGNHPYVYHRTPGFGDTNWTDLISILRLGGYTGSIEIEGWHDPVYRDELEMTGQVRALRYLQECRGGAFVPNPVVS